MESTNALTVHGDGSHESLPAPPSPTSGTLQIRSLDDLARLSGILATSGYFKDARDAAQAAVKVLYGAEIGIGPVQAMMNVHVIEGKPAPGAGLVAALIKRSGKYSYRVHRHEADGCEIEFFELIGGQMQPIGTSTFDEADAKRAGLLDRKGPWKSYPKAMMFARAVTQGARTYCPDVFGGAVYDPEELGGAAEPADEKRPARFPGESIYTSGVRELPPAQDASSDEAEVEVVDASAGDPAQLSLEDQMLGFKVRAKKARDWLLGLPEEEFEAAKRRADDEVIGWRPHEAREMGAMYVAQAVDKRAKLAEQVENLAQNAADRYAEGIEPARLREAVEEHTAQWPDYWRGLALATFEDAIAPPATASAAAEAIQQGKTALPKKSQQEA